MKIHIDLDLFKDSGAYYIDKDYSSLDAFVLPKAVIDTFHLNIVLDEGRNNFVYFLLDINEAKDIKRKIYIGETTDLPTRINTHKKNKLWWNTIVVFSNKKLEETDVNAIERILIGEYEDSDLYEVMNDQHPHKPIKDFHYKYAEYIVSIMDFLSYGVMKSVISEEREVTKPAPTKVEAEKKRRGRFTFSLIGLKPGDIISLVDDENIKFEIIDDEHVNYQGVAYRLSPLAEKLLTNRKPPLQGPKYFKYNGVILDDLRSEIEGTKVSSAPKTNNWIIACNKNYYDLDKAYSKIDTIDFKQTANIAAGSTVYIYNSKPDQRISYECKAVVVNKPAQTIDDSEFVLDEEGYTPSNRYMELKLVRKLDFDGLDLHSLKEHGLVSSLQGPCRTSIELQNYIDSIIK